MITLKKDEIDRWKLLLQRNKKGHYFFGIRSAINIIAKKNHLVTCIQGNTWTSRRNSSMQP